MTKLTRVTGKLFGETATATGDNPQIGQFGSGLAGTYVGTTDVATIQNLAAWSNGFIGCVTPDTQYPPLPEMTGFGKVLSYQQNYLLQQGVAEWDSATTYYQNSYVSYNGKIYISLTDNNLNKIPSSSTANWKVYGSDIYANRDLSNLSTTGQEVLNNKANITLDNLLTAGNNRLHALKGYEDNGTALTDSEGLADVTTYAHSTFDVSKFTVTGTPTITDDGIASGFSTSDYITAPSIDITNANTVILESVVQMPTTAPVSSGSEAALVCGKMIVGIRLNTNNCETRAGANSMTTYRVGQDSLPYDGSTYVIKAVFQDLNTESPSFYCKSRKINETQWSQKDSASTQSVLSGQTSANITIGKNGSNNPFSSGSINIKYTSITVDGVEAFSGNKTGIDTYTIGGNTVSVPYTLSKTGSKIVNSIYRTQVTAVYNEYGYAPYYTLDEANGNFTLPQGEIYGMINQKANYNEWVYADQSSALSTATAVGDYDLTTALAALLPDDTASYECIFRWRIGRNNAGGNTNTNYIIYAPNDKVVLYDSMDSLSASSSGDSVNHGGQFTAIIDATRYLKLTIDSQALESNWLYLVAYRKLS